MGKKRRNLKLNAQLILLTLVILVLPLSLLGFYFYKTTTDSLKDIGMERGVTSVHIAQSLLDTTGDNLLSITKSNSHWEEFREAIDKKDLPWIQVNVNENIASVSVLDFIVTTDNDGNVLSAEEKKPGIAAALDYGAILNRLSNDNEFYGFMNTAEGLGFVAVSKVTSENGKASPTGNLIFGSLLSAEDFNHLKDSLQAQLGIIDMQGNFFSSSESISLPVLQKSMKETASDSVFHETVIHDDVIVVHASKKINDIAGQPAGLMYLEYPLNTSTKVIKNLTHLSVFSIAIVMLLLVILTFVLQRRILLPLKHFKTALEQVAAGKSIDNVPAKVLANAESSILPLFHQLQKLSYYDYLTDLPNRRFSAVHLNMTLKEAESKKQRIAVMYLDLDRFKNINDTLGHPAGDRLLKAVAERLSEEVGNNGFVARLGGDEFTVILSKLTEPDEIHEIAEAVVAVFKKPFLVDGHELFITSSIGVSMYPDDGTTVDELFMNADTAMYRSKEQGRNKYHFYSSSMNFTLMTKVKMETDLRKALESNELFLMYQPKIDIETNKIVGAEALIRWLHPEQGIVPPAKFIPLAEEVGLISPIGEWVLKNACKQNKVWQDQGLPGVKMAVNVSARQFQYDNIVDAVSDALSETELNPEWLEIEITESTLMHSVNETIEILGNLSKTGISISIDDFGTGYSSLSYLKLFPINCLKIDQSFIKELEKNTGDLAIAKSIISLGHALNLEVVAEGVENRLQLDLLRKEKCDVYQGYYFSPPTTANHFKEMLKRQNSGKAHVTDLL